MASLWFGLCETAASQQVKHTVAKFVMFDCVFPKLSCLEAIYPAQGH